MTFSTDIHMEKDQPLPDENVIGVSMRKQSAGRRLNEDDEYEE